jgi:hypothetical protein
MNGLNGGYLNHRRTTYRNGSSPTGNAPWPVNAGTVRLRERRTMVLITEMKRSSRGTFRREAAVDRLRGFVEPMLKLATQIPILSDPGQQGFLVGLDAQMNQWCKRGLLLAPTTSRAMTGSRVGLSHRVLACLGLLTGSGLRGMSVMAARGGSRRHRAGQNHAQG